MWEAFPADFQEIFVKGHQALLESDATKYINSTSKTRDLPLRQAGGNHGVLHWPRLHKKEGKVITMLQYSIGVAPNS